MMKGALDKKIAASGIDFWSDEEAPEDLSGDETPNSTRGAAKPNGGPLVSIRNDAGLGSNAAIPRMQLPPVDKLSAKAKTHIIEKTLKGILKASPEKAECIDASIEESKGPTPDKSTARSSVRKRVSWDPFLDEKEGTERVFHAHDDADVCSIKQGAALNSLLDDDAGVEEEPSEESEPEFIENYLRRKRKCDRGLGLGRGYGNVAKQRERVLTSKFYQVLLSLLDA